MPQFNEGIKDVLGAIQMADEIFARQQQQKMMAAAGQREAELQPGRVKQQQLTLEQAQEALRQLKEGGQFLGAGTEQQPGQTPQAAQPPLVMREPSARPAAQPTSPTTFNDAVKQAKQQLGTMSKEETALLTAAELSSRAKRDPAHFQQAVATIMGQRGLMARDNPPVETPHTVTTGKGVFQYNPTTKLYDIFVGPPNREPGMNMLMGDELDKLKPQELALVKGIANYEVDPKTLSYRGGAREKYLSLAKLYDPSYDQTQYPARVSARRDFTSGKAANNIRSLNTVIGHLDTLQRAADSLDNSSISAYNYVSNLLLSNTGDPRIVRFNAAANAVESELANVFKGMGATDQEIKAWREQLSSSQSPEQLHGAIDQLVDLISSRMYALDSQYRVATGKPRDFHILNEHSRELLQGLGGYAQSLLESDQSVSGERTAPAQGAPGGKWNPVKGRYE